MGETRARSLVDATSGSLLSPRGNLRATGSSRRKSLSVVRRYSPRAHSNSGTRMSRDETGRRAGRHAWTLERGGLYVSLVSSRSPSAAARARRLVLSLQPPPRPGRLLARPPPRIPCQPTSRGRFRFVRAGAAVHQSLLVPAPAFDDRVAAARSVIARL